MTLTAVDGASVLLVITLAATSSLRLASAQTESVTVLRASSGPEVFSSLLRGSALTPSRASTSNMLTRCRKGSSRQDDAAFSDVVCVAAGLAFAASSAA